MAVPDYQTLMLPLLKRVVAADRPVGIMEIAPLIAGDLDLTEEQLAERVPSGRQATFHNRLHWAKQYMTRAGLFESTRHGQFQATAEGRALLAQGLTAINNDLLNHYPAFVAWKQGAASQDDVTGGTVREAVAALPPVASVATPEERIEAARRELEASLKAEILDRVREMTPGDFEAPASR